MTGNDRFNNRRRRRRAHPTVQSTNGEQLDSLANGRSINGSSHNDKRVVHSGNGETDKGHGHGVCQQSSKVDLLCRKTMNPCRQSWLWCLGLKTTATEKFSKLTRKQFRLLVVLKMILFVLKLMFLHWLFSKSSFSKLFVGRSLTDESLNEIPLVIPAFDYSQKRDVGGWKYPRLFFWPPVLSKNATQNGTLPDFGGLHIYRESFEQSFDDASRLAPKRQIHPDDARLAMEHWWEEVGKGDLKINSYDEWPDDVEDKKRTCRDPNWIKQYHPKCNSFHELTMTDRSDKKYVSHGTFRDVWLIDHPSIPRDPNEIVQQSALKMSRYKYEVNRDKMTMILNDAMVMERLAFSPRIVDIFGHCGTTVWVEPMPGDIEGVAVPGEGLIKQKDLNDEKKLNPQNDYTVEEKFEMALTFAEAIADIHGFRDGVIVHDDIQVAQFLKTPDGRIKFGDFNRATVLKWDSKDETYCDYSTSGRGWRNRAPEEYARKYRDKKHPNFGWMNEKIDVYSYGNGIYALLTGLWPFYEVDDDSTPRKMVFNGSTPFVDPRYKEQDSLTTALVEVMEDCWTYNSSERPSIFDVVKRLREARKIDQQNKGRKKDSVRYDKNVDRYTMKPK